ncbi:MAG: adenylosuccinate synthetase, partial [Terriglobales bacterium]
CTRVGGGPFPTECRGAGAEELRQRGNEFGSVTGRPRRVGWFDGPLMRYAARLNCLNSLIITKLDVLDTLERVPVCVGYKVGGKASGDLPARAAAWAGLEPVYEALPGWQSSTEGITERRRLPVRARAYLDFLEREAGVEIGMISTGPEREQTITVANSHLGRRLPPLRERTRATSHSAKP